MHSNKDWVDTCHLELAHHNDYSAWLLGMNLQMPVFQGQISRIVNYPQEAAMNGNLTLTAANKSELCKSQD